MRSLRETRFPGGSTSLTLHAPAASAFLRGYLVPALLYAQGPGPCKGHAITAYCADGGRPARVAQARDERGGAAGRAGDGLPGAFRHPEARHARDFQGAWRLLMKRQGPIGFT